MEDKYKNKLRNITAKTKKIISEKEVCTPSDYEDIFIKESDKEDFNLDKIEGSIICKQDITIEYIDKILKKYSDNLSEFEKDTTSATIAIDKKDIKKLLEIKERILTLKKENNMLKENILKDPLTQIFNRQYINDNILTNNHCCFKKDGVMCFIDLDYFKDINDNYGHSFGDKILIFVVSFLKNFLISKKLQFDFVRYAGDEFVIFFKNNYDCDNINKLLLEAQKNIMSKKLSYGENIKNVSISFSFGVLKYKKKEKWSKTLEKADFLMYENKKKRKK